MNEGSSLRTLRRGRLSHGINHMFLLLRLGRRPRIISHTVRSALTLFVSPPPQAQENVFVEFNHQELLEFYNKVS